MNQGPCRDHAYHRSTTKIYQVSRLPQPFPIYHIYLEGKCLVLLVTTPRPKTAKSGKWANRGHLLFFTMIFAFIFMCVYFLTSIFLYRVNKTKLTDIFYPI